MPSERKSSRKPRGESSGNGQQTVSAPPAPPEWDKNDHALAWVRLKRLWHQLHLKLDREEASCRIPFQVADLRVAFIHQMVGAADRTYRKVWQEGGRSVTPEFIRWVANEPIQRLVISEVRDFAQRIISTSFPTAAGIARPIQYPGLAIPLGLVASQIQSDKEAVWKYFTNNLRAWLANDWGLAIAEEQFAMVVRTKAASSHAESTQFGDGAADQRPATKSARSNWHSLNYQTITVNGTVLHATPNQAGVIQALDDAQSNGMADISKRELEKKIGAPRGRLWDSFRAADGPKIRTLLIDITRKGFYKLTIPR